MCVTKHLAAESGTVVEFIGASAEECMIVITTTVASVFSGGAVVHNNAFTHHAALFPVYYTLAYGYGRLLRPG